MYQAYQVCTGSQQYAAKNHRENNNLHCCSRGSPPIFSRARGKTNQTPSTHARTQAPPLSVQPLHRPSLSCPFVCMQTHLRLTYRGRNTTPKMGVSSSPLRHLPSTTATAATTLLLYRSTTNSTGVYLLPTIYNQLYALRRREAIICNFPDPSTRPAVFARKQDCRRCRRSPPAHLPCTRLPYQP